MKHMKCVPLVVCLLAPWSALAGDNEIRQAVQALERKDFAAAASVCQKAIQANPSDAAAHYTLGVVRWNEVYQAPAAARPAMKAQLAQGQQALARALELEPGFGYVLLYQNLMFRLEASLAGSDSRAKELTAKADALIARAAEWKKSGRWKELQSPVPLPPPPPRAR